MLCECLNIHHSVYYYHCNHKENSYHKSNQELDEKNEYNIDAQERIKSLLKSPSTAKFPSINDWKFGKDNGIVIVQAYVDSENSFGAKLRSEFQIKYDSNKNVVSLIIDGVEYIK